MEEEAGDRYDGPYTPPWTKKTLDYAGLLAVFDWGGVAVDPRRPVQIGTPVRRAYVFQLIPRPAPKANVATADDKEHFNENYGARYAAKLDPFRSPLGLPCQAP